MDSANSALTQLKAWLAQRDLPDDSRLPSERELVEILGVPRGELRKALAQLVDKGQLWRHVGKGTFIGARPIKEQSSVSIIATQTNPLEVMQARLVIEPVLAREAAINATGAHQEELKRCIRLQHEAETWRQYENADNSLHRAVAEASSNTVLTALFDQLNAVRRAVVWGRLRDESKRPPMTHHSFSQHEIIVNMIQERDQEGAYQAMRDHLMNVRDNLLQGRAAAE